MESWTADKFRRCIEDLDFHALAGLYAGDAVLDVTVGPWRYHRQEAHAIAEPYRQDFPVRPVLAAWRERATEWGAVVEVEARRREAPMVRR